MKNKLLLLDSQQIRRNNTLSRLRTKNFEVEPAEGGFQLLSMIEKSEFGALIIFGDSFDMSGTEIISLIRINFTKTELPIIYIHNSKSQDDIIDSFELGANEVIIQNSKYFVSLLERLQRLTK